MNNSYSNLRKAAVLIRSLDADAAAELLGQLSASEAESVREAIRALGPIDPDEQADLLAEFRRAQRLATESAQDGVELSISKPADNVALQAATPRGPQESIDKRFDFLQHAPTSVLVSYLSREHAQTIAVVLSLLTPAHAAGVLAALPENLQAETIERLSVLGDTDRESIAVLESELAAWVAKRMGGRAERGRRREAVAAILAAANDKTRNVILKRLKCHDLPSADLQSQKPRESASATSNSFASPKRSPVKSAGRVNPSRLNSGQAALLSVSGARLPAPSAQQLPAFDFEQLIHLDDGMLAAVLHEVDANALALALAGAGDELVDRICVQMPKRAAKVFRRELRHLGPTRLSDVEAAQAFVARLASQQIARRRTGAVIGAGR